MRSTKIPPNILLGISAFLVRYHRTTIGSDRSKSTRHRLVVAKQLISMQFDKIAESQFQIIQGKWTCRMPVDQDPLPSSEILVDLFSCFLDLSFHGLDFPLEVDRL